MIKVLQFRLSLMLSSISSVIMKVLSVCSAWTRMLPAVWEWEQVVWLRWQESDLCVSSPSHNLNSPLKHAVAICWQIDKRCYRQRWQNQQLLLSWSYLPVRLWSSSLLQGPVPEMTRALCMSYLCMLQRCMSLEVRLCMVILVHRAQRRGGQTDQRQPAF